MAALPKNIKEDWEEKTEATRKVPEVDELIDFIRRKARTMATTLTTTPTPEVKKEPKPQPRRERQQQRPKAVVNTSATPLPPQPPVQSRPITSNSQPSNSYQGFRYQCMLCSDYHPLFMCSRFNTVPISQRKEHIKSNHLCFNCLAPGQGLRSAGAWHGARPARISTTQWSIRTGAIHHRHNQWHQQTQLHLCYRPPYNPVSP